MGMLDRPSIDELDALEKKARKGDEKVLAQFIYPSLPTIQRVHIDRLMNRDGLTMKEALEKMGIVICIR